MIIPDKDEAPGSSPGGPTLTGHSAGPLEFAFANSRYHSQTPEAGPFEFASANSRYLSQAQPELGNDLAEANQIGVGIRKLPLSVSPCLQRVSSHPEEQSLTSKSTHRRHIRNLVATHRPGVSPT